jgi:cytochrome P450
MSEQHDPLDPDPARRSEAYAALRSQCPVHQVGPGRFLALDHHSVQTGLRSVSDFGGSAGQYGLPEEDTSVAGLPEPRHGWVRRIINSVVAFHKSQEIEPYLADLCKRLAQDTVAAEGVESSDGIDVMPLFVDPLPPAAMARLLGFPAEDSSRYYKWGVQLGTAFAEAVANGRSISMREGSPEMAQYVDERIAERALVPVEDWPNDALSRFLTTAVDGEALSHRAIAIQVMFAIGAGSETTRNTLGSLLFRLAQDPELYAEIRGDRSMVEPTVEEALRIDAPAQFMVRRCLIPERELGGLELHEGDSLMLSIGAANLDPAAFNDPLLFDPHREGLRDHLTFGTGPHICPGAALARLELRLGLNAWCDHVESFALGTGYSWDFPKTGMIHGPETLRLRLTPSNG